MNSSPALPWILTYFRRLPMPIGACLLWSALLVGPLLAEQPSWKTGVSTWNHSRYEIPVATPDSNRDSTAASATTPYTVPANPSAPRLNPYYSTPELAGSPSAPSAVVSPTSNDDNPIATADSGNDLISEDVDRQASATSDPVGSIVAGPDDELADIQQVSLTAPRGSPAANTIAEPLPLQAETIHWYQYPQRWMQGWDSHAEFGLDGSRGNANTLALQTGLEMKRQTDLHTFAIDIDYRKASTGSLTTEDNGRVNVDYDRMIAESNWSAFSKFGMEWDQFKAFDLRLNLNGGLGYHWIREESTTLVTRFGAGASREIGAPIDKWTPEAVFGIDAERQLNARNKLKGKLDYFPSWEDFSDFRLVADAAWEILLDDSDNLSLKLAVTDRYDSTPQGAKPNDVYYSLLLLYKF
jgi:putative salt-induced outer membrane protein YdiY